MSNPPARCMGCKAPIQFQPGAGSRLCPFCGYVNLVREQRLAVPPLELHTDEVFDRLQRGKLTQTIKEADKLLDPENQSIRLTFYRACALYGLGKIDDAIYTLIDLTGQEAPLALRADTHSYLARALLAAPSLLLLDEPLSSLDHDARREILPYLEALVQRLELPVLHVTHDVVEASRLADHLVVMRDGRVLTDGPLARVLTKPAPGLASGPEAAAVVAATVSERDAHDQLATCAFDGGELLTPDPGLAVGTAVRVRILARDVSLALAPAEGTSILNILSVTVIDRTADGESREMVRLAAGGTMLLAAVTRRSADALGLVAGQVLYAQIKSLALL